MIHGLVGMSELTSIKNKIYSMTSIKYVNNTKPLLHKIDLNTSQYLVYIKLTFKFINNSQY